VAYIGTAPTAGQYRKLDNISSSFNGSTTTFTTQVGGQNVSAGTPSQLLVSLGGVIQQPTTDYTVSTNSLTFVTAPASGLSFFAILMGDALSVGTPADGSVSTAKLATGLTVDLTSGSAAAPSLTFDANTGLYSPAEDTIGFVKGGVEAARIDSSGRLLVGTSSTSSSALFQVQGNSSSSTGDAIIQLRVGKNNVGILNGNSLGSIQFSNSESTVSAVIEAVADANWNTTNDYPSRLVFSVTADGASSPTEAMRITNARKVRIDGATVPAAAKLGVTASLTDDNGILIKNSVAQAGGQNYMVFYNSSDNLAGSIQHTGATTVNYSTSSDYRLKENVTPVSGAVIRLQQLKPCRFNFKTEPEKTVDGFLAHQVQAVVPEAISGTKDEVDADGKPIYQGIDQSKLVPLLTAALQEAISEIESLKARVAALESA